MKKKDVDREYRKFIENWLPKYSERLTFILLNLKEKRDIKESDWDVMNTTFRTYYFGYLPDFIPPWQPYDKKEVTQATIFDNNLDIKAEGKDDEHDKEADINLGLDFDTVLPEPIIEIENEKETLDK